MDQQRQRLIEQGERQADPDPRYTTIREIEAVWGHSPDEWGILGPVPEPDEEVRFVFDPESRKWRFERQLDDGSEYLTGIWYAALEMDFTDADLDGI